MRAALWGRTIKLQGRQHKGSAFALALFISAGEKVRAHTATGRVMHQRPRVTRQVSKGGNAVPGNELHILTSDQVWSALLGRIGPSISHFAPKPYLGAKPLCCAYYVLTRS